MKNVREIYKLDEDGYLWVGSYEELLNTFEYEIIIKEDEQDYQGDSLVIFKDKERYGLLIFGWGSCSGCDALQACENYEELEQLQKNLFNNIQWEENLLLLIKKINEKDWEATWLDVELRNEFVRKANEYYQKGGHRK